MTILRSSCFLFLLFISCKEEKESKSYASNDLKIVFIDTLSKANLCAFRFGICSEKEELPLDFILNRENKLIDKKNAFVLVSNIRENKQNLYGYFVKKGYQTKKFLLNKKDNYQSISILPEPSVISIKALDKEISYEIDSINISFEIKKKDVINKEFYKFGKKDLTPNLEYFNRNINPGESIKINIEVFKNSEIYQMKRILDYHPWLNTSIVLI